jgi:hypothetical protein
MINSPKSNSMGYLKCIFHDQHALQCNITPLLLQALSGFLPLYINDTLRILQYPLILSSFILSFFVIDKCKRQNHNKSA